jgi:hypothetical protein
VIMPLKAGHRSSRLITLCQPSGPRLATGRAPTYLTGCPRQQDGVVVEQTRERPCVIEQAGVLEQCFQLLRAGGAGGHVGTRKLGRVARPTA